MIQDIAPHTLDNQYHPKTPRPDSPVLVFCAGCLLTAEINGEVAFVPYSALAQTPKAQKVQYLFAVDGEDWFILVLQNDETTDGIAPAAYQSQPVSFFRTAQPKQKAYAAVTAFHLYNWYDTTRYCGRCGQKLAHDKIERMMRCTTCGNLVYPRISLSVIVGVTDGDRILMTTYAGRAYTRYALIAGFTEIGETPEETVAREVMEEVGLKVKNIRYYKSQPWGFTGGLLLGYFCELDGSDVITLDTNELASGVWLHRSELGEAQADDGVSLTREMVRVFKEKQ